MALKDKRENLKYMFTYTEKKKKKKKKEKEFNLLHKTTETFVMSFSSQRFFHSSIHILEDTCQFTSDTYLGERKID